MKMIETEDVAMETILTKQDVQEIKEKKEKQEVQKIKEQEVEETKEVKDGEKEEANKKVKGEGEEEKEEATEKVKEGEEEELHIPSIVDSLTQEQIDNFKPYYERYFEEKYCTRLSTPDLNLDTCLRVHSNKVSLVFLSKKHALITSGQKIKKLNFQVSPKVNRLKNNMSGKGKRGAQLLTPEAVLCFIEVENGDIYPVHCGIYGKLLEINDNIIENPNLIIENLSEGFIAAILPDIRKHESNMKSLVSKEDYYSVQ